MLHGKSYNSQLKLGDSYFKSRGYNDSFQKKGLGKFKKIRENMTKAIVV